MLLIVLGLFRLESFNIYFLAQVYELHLRRRTRLLDWNVYFPAKAGNYPDLYVYR